MQHRNIIRADLDRPMPELAVSPLCLPAEQSASPSHVAPYRVWRQTGPWPQRGFSLMLDLDAAFICRVPNCRCPPNLSAWRPAATFFELEEANSKNVPNTVGTACLRTCVQHECATDGANPCAKTGACLVRSRWGNVQRRWRQRALNCANSVVTSCRTRCEHLALLGFQSTSSCDATIHTRFNGSSALRSSSRCSYCSNSCSSSSFASRAGAGRTGRPVPSARCP